MVLDSIIVIACILAFYRGWKKGLVSAVLSLVGVLLGTILSLKLSHSLASFLNQQNIINSQYMLPIAFIVIFVATIFVVRLIINAAEGLLKLALLGWANRLAGSAIYVFFSLFFISAMFWLCNIVGVITPQAKSESKGYAVVEPIANKSIEVITQYMPFCSDLVQKIKQFSSSFSSSK
jgi:membrane protein required for colicin V production